MSIRIDRLAAARLTERAPARTDGRSRPIRLTGKGRRRWQAATAERTQLEATLTHQALTSTELQELNLLLAKLLAAFEERFGTAPVRGPGQADQPSL